MFLKILLTVAFTGFTAAVFAFEVKYTRPVKALVNVSSNATEYNITGLFEREKRFSTAQNRARERKYVRLLAEDALRRYLRQEEQVTTIAFSGADITSNLTKAGPDDKISFKYSIPFSGCRKIYKKEAPVPIPAEQAAASAAPKLQNDSEKTVHDEVLEPAQPDTSETNSDEITFEIASPETVFDQSWRSVKEVELKSRRDINRIMSEFKTSP